MKCEYCGKPITPQNRGYDPDIEVCNECEKVDRVSDNEEKLKLFQKLTGSNGKE